MSAYFNFFTVSFIYKCNNEIRNQDMMIGTIMISIGAMMIGAMMIWRAVSGEARRGYRY